MKINTPSLAFMMTLMLAYGVFIAHTELVGRTVKIESSTVEIKELGIK